MKQQKQNIEEVRAEEELEVPPDLDFNRLSMSREVIGLLNTVRPTTVSDYFVCSSRGWISQSQPECASVEERLAALAGFKVNNEIQPVAPSIDGVYDQRLQITFHVLSLRSAFPTNVEREVWRDIFLFLMPNNDKPPGEGSQPDMYRMWIGQLKLSKVILISDLVKVIPLPGVRDEYKSEVVDSEEVRT
ncbi:hypothetical protein BSL78_12242 [Apostichopus japonicus]|uniref:tRNA uridine 5-carboxymethylaminomethyl modification enzyme C-terminal subdomain domain-containing protein n=1 Tax=Stichopus japonicus TaxID=307972 RepID=A0A2G8KS76_STIJA|nr:hypothetical protein BSL78_12242 [Apostichopus japonicus]